MEKSSLCEVCGNEVNDTLPKCPYCNQPRKPEALQEISEDVRTLNLEKGMPVVADALRRFESELASAQGRVKVLVLIHGYGSKGKGGLIKKAVRDKIDLYIRQGRLKDILIGEKCGKRSGHARLLLKRFPALEEFLQHPNPGITLVVL